MQFTLVLLTLLSCASCAHISYQLHSYDDWREWDALLLKRATWLKLDTHFVPPSQCKLFPTHRCGPHGLLLLSHDDPTTHNVLYSSIDDLISWLSSRTNMLYVSHFPDPLFFFSCLMTLFFFCFAELEHRSVWKGGTDKQICVS